MHASHLCKRAKQAGGLVATLVLCLSSVSVGATDFDLGAGLDNSNETSTHIELDKSAKTSILDSLPDGKDKPKKRYSPWGMAFFQIASHGWGDLNRGEGRLETYNFLSFDYRINWNSKLALRPEFFLKGSGLDYKGDAVASEFELGNVYLQYSHYDIALLPGDIGLMGAFRVYLPNSQYAKETHMITQLQGRLIFTRPMGYGMELNYHLRPKYYMYGQRGYVNEFFNVHGNKWGELEHYLEFAKRFTPGLGVTQEVGWKTQWRYDVPSEGVANRVDDYFKLSTAIAFRAGGVSFKAGVKNEIKLHDKYRERKGVPYDPAHSELFLMTYVRM